MVMVMLTQEQVVVDQMLPEQHLQELDKEDK
jgi:hypothetical protein